MDTGFVTSRDRDPGAFAVTRPPVLFPVTLADFVDALPRPCAHTE